MKKILNIIIYIMLLKLNSTAVIFGESSLLKVIKKCSGIEENTPLPEAFYETKKCLVLKNSSITDLAGIKYFKNLESLDISFNNIWDLSEILLLPSLKSLNISGCKIKDISILYTLSNLEELIADGNDIRSIMGIARMKSLKIVSLSNNRIETVEELLELEKYRKDQNFRIELYNNPLSAKTVRETIPFLLSKNIAVRYGALEKLDDFSLFKYKEINKTAGVQNTPHKIIDWMRFNFEFDLKNDKSYPSCPSYDIFKLKKGSSADYTALVFYFLKYNNYDAKIISVKTEDGCHCLPVYKCNDCYYAIDLNRLSGPYRSLEEIASGSGRKWLSYEIFSTLENFIRIKKPETIVEKKI
jgi:Leucine Rich repeat